MYWGGGSYFWGSLVPGMSLMNFLLGGVLVNPLPTVLKYLLLGPLCGLNIVTRFASCGLMTELSFD